MKLHYYKCSNPDILPDYKEFNFEKGMVGFERKLSQAFVAVHGIRYLGYGTEAEVYVPLTSSPGKIVKASYGGFGDRY